jgi:hypothetical protein
VLYTDTSGAIAIAIINLLSDTRDCRRCWACAPGG